MTLARYDLQPEPDDVVARRLAQDEDRERAWARYIADTRDFAANEVDGYAAVLRAVAEAMKGQAALWR